MQVDASGDYATMTVFWGGNMTTANNNYIRIADCNEFATSAALYR